MAGIGIGILKNGGKAFSDRNRKTNRKSDLKKRSGIRNSVEFRRNSAGFPNQALHVGSPVKSNNQLTGLCDGVGKGLGRGCDNDIVMGSDDAWGLSQVAGEG